MVIQAQEAERQKLSRQVHDGPAQALSNFICRELLLYETTSLIADDLIGYHFHVLQAGKERSFHFGSLEKGLPVRGGLFLFTYPQITFVVDK